MSYRNLSRIFRRSRKLMAFFAAMAVLVSGTALWSIVSLSPQVYAEETEEELQDQINDLESDKEQLEADRNESEAKLEEQEALKADIEAQISNTIASIEENQQKLDAMDVLIDETNYEIALKQQSIAEKEAEIAQAFSDLKERLRVISKTGSLTSMLQMIMSSDGFEDYLIKTKAMQRISEENEALMNQLEDEMQIINAEKEALEAQKAKAEEDRKPYVELETTLHNKKLELDVLYSEKNAVTEQLNQDIDYYNTQIAQNEADQAALEAKIDELIQQNAASSSGQSYASGSMYNPAPSCEYISSTYKYRWGRWHNGVDMCGSACYGSAIYAAADGVVTYSDWMSGYGWCVVIDHGTDENGYNVSTLYAHCAELYVYEGQSVTGGSTTIAAVGSSGNSTGPHLHFEVRLDGDPVDPLGNGYISAGDFIIDESL